MKISIFLHYFFSLAVVFYLISNAAASGPVDGITMTEATAVTTIVTSSQREEKTHYGIGYEQRMELINNQTRLTSGAADRPVIRSQRIARPVRPSRPQRPTRPGR